MFSPFLSLEKQNSLLEIQVSTWGSWNSNPESDSRSVQFSIVCTLSLEKKTEDIVKRAVDSKQIISLNLIGSEKLLLALKQLRHIIAAVFIRRLHWMIWMMGWSGTGCISKETSLKRVLKARAQYYRPDLVSEEWEWKVLAKRTWWFLRIWF